MRSNFLEGSNYVDMSGLMPKGDPIRLTPTRARIDMKAAETVIHLRREMPDKMKNMVPAHVWHLVEPYGMGPTEAEKTSLTKKLSI